MTAGTLRGAPAAGERGAAAAPSGGETGAPGRPPEPSLADPCAERGAVTERLLAERADGAEGPAPDLDVFLSGQVFMDMIFTGLPGLPPPGTELFTDGLGSAP